MELTVIVHRERDGFWSEVAELPGCFASGRTLGELHEALGESVGLYLYDSPIEVADPLGGTGQRKIHVSGPGGPGAAPDRPGATPSGPGATDS